MLQREDVKDFSAVKRPAPPTLDLAARAAQSVVDDLERHCQQSENPRRRLKYVAKRIEIHEKTLTRLLARENKPTYMTIFKIYRYLLNEMDDARLLELMPPDVAEFLRQANPQTIEKHVSYATDLEKQMCVNPVMAEIVVLCATGPVKLSYLKSRFGDYGLKVVEDLLTRDVLKSLTRSEVCQGQVQVNMAPETVARVAIQMVQQHLKTENSYVSGGNFVGFYAEGLNDGALQKWLAIDAKAYREKVEIARAPESRGNLRAFTFCATDTVDMGLEDNLNLPRSANAHLKDSI